MRRSVVGLAAAALLSSSAQSAFAAPPTAPDTAPVAAPAASSALTSRADVDGDGRRDTITLVRRAVTPDEYRFRLAVVTASGKRAIRDVLVPNYGDGSLQPADVWIGTASVDGARGVEMAVERSGNVGDFPWPHLYTWRSGRIVPETAPGAPVGETGWTVANHFSLIQGYDIRTVKGRRQVTATVLKGTFDPKRETATFRGTRTTYRWERGTWRKVSTHRTRTLSDPVAQRYAGWHGITWRG